MLPTAIEVPNPSPYSSGTPYVLYGNCEVNNELWVAHKSGGSWSSELVDTNDFDQSLGARSLAIDRDDNQSFSYSKRAGVGAPSDLRFASNAAGCSSAADCIDGNECTDDLCVSGSCQNPPKLDNTPCNVPPWVCCDGTCSSPCLTALDCDDGDICTDDACIDDDPNTCSFCDHVFDPSNDPSCDACVPTHSKEKGPRCSDGLDNDCDGWIDGADPDCQ